MCCWFLYYSSYSFTRCGIIHARGPIPPNKLTKEDINEFQKRFNDKLMPILTFQDKIKQEDVAKLGMPFFICIKFVIDICIDRLLI